MNNSMHKQSVLGLLQGATQSEVTSDWGPIMRKVLQDSLLFNISLMTWTQVLKEC